MIYIRCPFCDKVSAEIEGNATLEEPIANYYSVIIMDVDGVLKKQSKHQVSVINDLMYFPHDECYDNHVDVESRRKKVFGPGSMVH